VIDHGPGVPTPQWDQIFQPFQRLDDRDNHSGVGLGLALARGLVEAMGGSLVPDETPGGGLTMIIALPATGFDDDDIAGSASGLPVATARRGSQ
jgi:two-component system sensor histidine kinase KdpD